MFILFKEKFYHYLKLNKKHYYSETLTLAVKNESKLYISLVYPYLCTEM